jgi:hypothetical protein
MDDYVDVAERIRQFREQHPEGSLQPADVTVPFVVQSIGDQTFIVVVAAAYRAPDDARPGVGMAYEQFPGRTPYTRGSELQNAETSAWGRAIVAALAADTKKIASADEVRNRQAEREQQQQSENARKVFRDITTYCNGQGFDLQAVSQHFQELYQIDASKAGEAQLVEFLARLKTDGLPGSEAGAE